MNDFIKNAIQESLENKGIKDGEIINMNKLVDVVLEILQENVIHEKPTKKDIEKEFENQLKDASRGRRYL